MTTTTIIQNSYVKSFMIHRKDRYSLKQDGEWIFNIKRATYFL